MHDYWGKLVNIFKMEEGVSINHSDMDLDGNLYNILRLCMTRFLITRKFASVDTFSNVIDCLAFYKKSEVCKPFYAWSCMKAPNQCAWKFWDAWSDATSQIQEPIKGGGRAGTTRSKLLTHFCQILRLLFCSSKYKSHIFRAIHITLFHILIYIMSHN